MSVKFRVLQQPVLVGKNKGKTMQVARVLSTRKVTFNRLCEEISDGSSVDTADVKAVLDRLVRILRRHMEDGDSVECGDLGTFSPSIASEMVAADQEFNALTHIHRLRINFRAKPQFKDMRSVRFERISKEEEKARALLTAKKKGSSPSVETHSTPSDSTSDHLGV